MVLLSKFARDTAAVPAGGGHYDMAVDEGWTIYLGPNGGYVAALAARALCAEAESVVQAPELRRLRSLNTHFLSPLSAGDLTAEVRVERSGRSVGIASAILRQEGRTGVMARAAFTASRPGIDLAPPPPPSVPPPEDLPPLDVYIPPGFRDRYERRWAIGPMPHSLADVPVAGGWIRLARTESGSPAVTLDASLLVAYSDCWFPALYAMTQPATRVYTVDLTVHLVTPLPTEYDDWVLVEFRGVQAADGLVVEDGRIWTRAGELLAISRQLAVVRTESGGSPATESRRP